MNLIPTTLVTLTLPTGETRVPISARSSESLLESLRAVQAFLAVSLYQTSVNG